MKYSSRVIAGKGRGKGIGFPTFNLEIPDDLSEKNGIYAGAVTINNKIYPGAFHYGPIPTFDEVKTSLEVYVLDYSDLNKVEKIDFELKSYLREIKRFNAPKKLRVQIESDVSKTRKIFSENKN